MSQQVSPQYACALLFRSVRLQWSYTVNTICVAQTAWLYAMPGLTPTIIGVL